MQLHLPTRLQCQAKVGMGFAVLREHPMRIYKANKINDLYVIDFIGYFVSI